MSSVQVLSELQIYTDKVQYEKKEKRLTITLTDFTFVGQYKPSTLIGTILDDLHASLTVFQVERSNIFLIDGITMQRISEEIKLKDALVEKKEEEEDKGKDKKVSKEREFKPAKTKQKVAKKGKMAMRQPAIAPEIRDAMEMKREISTPVEMAKEDRGGYKMMEDEEMFDLGDDMEMEMKLEEAPPMEMRKKAVSASMAPPPVSAPSRGAPASFAYSEAEKAPSTGKTLAAVAPPPKMKVYDINMGLQYYPVMMENQRYLFYVHLSHKKLKIQDEEGKVVYETTFRVVTTKPEPPKLDLTIEGKGFEIHPLSGTVEVKKKTVNPPLMIFSITAKKGKEKLSKKEKKKGITRYLNIIVDFEGKNVSHTVLAIKVQSKFFKLGPLNLSKTQAMIISVLPIIITVISFGYSIYTLMGEGASGSSITGMIPGGGTLIFAVTFIYTLLKKGVFPMKKKVQGFLDFDKGATMK